MLDNPILNLVILLSFIYFIGSLLVSTINEAISSVFKLRNKTLREGIDKLLFQDDWKQYVEGHFLKNPFIQSLQKDAKHLPSYIPSKNFALAILEHCRFDKCEKTVKEMEKAVENCILPKSMQNILVAMLHHTGCDMKKLQAELENFYNNAMDRVTGWYKKKIQYIIIAISFVLAAFLNVDTIHIMADALHNPQKLSETADKIAQSLPNMHLNGDSVVINHSGNNIYVKALPSQQKKNVFADKQLQDSVSPGTTIKHDISSLKSLAIVYTDNTGYSLGYRDLNDAKMQWGSVGNFLKKLIGVLLTAFAVQLGSNYWFDLLNKFVNLRGAGKKPENGDIKNNA